MGMSQKKKITKAKEVLLKYQVNKNLEELDRITWLKQLVDADKNNVNQWYVSDKNSSFVNFK